METLKRYKNILLGGVIIVVLFIGYSIFFTGDDPTVLRISEEEESAIERELLALLLELRSVELDGAIFNDPTFRSLEDFSQPLSPQPVGRENPFAPISGSAPVSE